MRPSSAVQLDDKICVRVGLRVGLKKTIPLKPPILLGSRGPVYVQVPSSALVRKSLKTLIYKDLRDFLCEK